VHHQIPLTRILDVMEYEAPIQSSGLRARAQSNNERSNVQQENTSQYMDPMAKKAYEHCFQIITPKRTFKLCATVRHFDQNQNHPHILIGYTGRRKRNQVD